MNAKDKKQRFFHIYEQLFQYKDLIKGAPVLTMDLKNMPAEQAESFFSQIREELGNTTSYLLGLRGAHFPVNVLLDALNKHYQKDDFWRNLLLDYIELIQEEAEEELETQKTAVQQQGLSLYKKLREFQRRRKEIINSFVQKMAPKKFPINAERLFKNYLNMADIDEELAWNTLIENPAAFSPIITDDGNGNRTLSVSAAKEMNKRIGDFIRKMKA